MVGARPDVRLNVACSADAPAIVRHALSQQSELGWILGDMLLVASELVTNAVQHSGGSAAHSITVELRRKADAVSLAVSDPGAAGGAAAVARAEQPAGGLGLKVVELLSAGWGAAREPDGRYTVWAELRYGGPISC